MALLLEPHGLVLFVQVCSAISSIWKNPAASPQSMQAECDPHAVKAWSLIRETVHGQLLSQRSSKSGLPASSDFALRGVGDHPCHFIDRQQPRLSKAVATGRTRQRV